MIKSFLLILFLGVNLLSASQEICNNGIDDDGDGSTDLQDTDCSSTIFPLIKNPSFEHVYQCPTFYSQLQYADYWVQPIVGNIGSTDLYHPCGNCSYPFNGMVDLMPKPIPDGAGFVGFIDSKEWKNNGPWKEYLSTCLEKELLKDSMYVLDFYLAFITPLITNPGGDNFFPYSPVSLSLFGHSSCSAIPYAPITDNSYRYCPMVSSPEWVELAKLSVTGTSGQWVRARVEFKAPANISSFVIGPSCEVSPHGSNNHAGYYGIDQLLLYQKDVYDLPVITRSGDICGDTLVLTAVTNLPVPAGSWQWYKDQVALPGETEAELRLTRAQYGTGTYKVRLSANQKTFLSPEAIVTIDDTGVSLPDSVSFCASSSIELTPQISQEDETCPVTYVWNDGLTDISRNVSAPGLYWFESNKNGCRSRDSVRVIEQPAPLVNLGADTTLCASASLELSAGNPGAQYLWQNNTTAASFRVRSPGTYHVQVSANGCTVSDTIEIRYERSPELVFPPDTILCQDEQKQLAPFVHGNQFLWNTGSTSPQITVTQPGTYTLEVQNWCGTTADSITIIRSNCEFWLPSAFTPNNDGKNDRFGLAMHGFIKKYECKIFNRWGQLVFTSTDPARHWDGSINGKYATPGVYIWLIKYTDWSGREHVEKGTVALIR